MVAGLFVIGHEREEVADTGTDCKIDVVGAVVADIADVVVADIADVVVADIADVVVADRAVVHVVGMADAVVADSVGVAAAAADKIDVQLLDHVA